MLSVVPSVFLVWRACLLYTSNETYTPKIKAELQPRASNTEQAVINLKYEGNIVDKQWLIFQNQVGSFKIEINQDKEFYLCLFYTSSVASIFGLL